jgi:hypothetical protein
MTSIRKSFPGALLIFMTVFAATLSPDDHVTGAALSAPLDAAFTLSIPIVPGGAITVERDGLTPEVIGRVLSIPETTRWPSFTASAWGREGTVVATAVNAIHILLSVENGRGRTISILPADTVAPAAGPGASVITDMKPGRSIFGAWAPTAGSTVEGASVAMKGNTLRILMTPSENPYFLEIENRPGGRVTAWYESGPCLIARVIRPVAGSGRFEGTIFQERGRIRANHPGVIDICTSPEGVVGGFQIMPLEHASSAEMQGAWKMTQWMILASVSSRGFLKGRAPLFSDGLLPGPGNGEKLWDIWSTYGRRPLVLARVKGGPWTRLPEASGRMDHALEGITHLRIYYPFTGEPQGGVAEQHPSAGESLTPQ